MPKKVPGAVVVVVCGAAARNKAVTMVTWCEGAVHEAWELGVLDGIRVVFLSD